MDVSEYGGYRQNVILLWGNDDAPVDARGLSQHCLGKPS